MPHSAAFHLGLHCLPKYKGLKIIMNIFLVLFKSFSGLDSILFAISVDNAELNAVRQVSNVINVGNVAVSPSRAEEEPRPVIAGDSSSGMLAIPH